MKPPIQEALPQKQGGASEPEQASTTKASLELDEAPLPQEQSIERRREETRITITGGLLFLFGLVLFAGIVAAFVGERVWTNAEELLRLVLPALTALLGTALGFYFGSQK